MIPGAAIRKEAGLNPQLATPGKRRGWIAPLMLGVKRELNWREQTRYERYCQYCEETIGCKPAKDHIWYVVNQSLPSV